MADVCTAFHRERFGRRRFRMLSNSLSFYFKWLNLEITDFFARFLTRSKVLATPTLCIIYNLICLWRNNISAKLFLVYNENESSLQSVSKSCVNKKKSKTVE